MSNDNKTLADVQPGGRVRLATVLYDRAHDLLGDAYNAGTHGIGYSQQAMELHDAIIPAQPSPGGQGDALLESLVARWRNHAEEIGVSDNLLCQKIANCTMRHAAELQAVLAARQPVGEPPMEMRICELRHVSLKPNRPYIFTVDANCANCRADAAYAMGRTDTPPAHAVDLGKIIEQIAQQRDGCSYDAVGETIDVGQAIRATGKRLAMTDSQAVGNG